MNNRIAVRRCDEYDPERIKLLIAEIYEATGGPEPGGKKILLKPNILLDSDPANCISSHPAVVEALILYLTGRGATVSVGDSPAIHSKGFLPVRCGIKDVCDRTGATWVDFRAITHDVALKKGNIKVTSAIKEADFIISVPKFKNHELMYFTGAIKNTLGLVPGFIKGKQHALHQSRNKFGEFLVNLNEAVLPDYFLMDAIMGMEGPGPGHGVPVKIGLILGSTNPLALDLTASAVAGYEPMTIPTNRIALTRKRWLKDENEIEYDGPDRESVRVSNFRKIPISESTNISLQFVMRRIKVLRKLEKRPVFIHSRCTGCLKCVKICPVNAISPDAAKVNYINLTDNKCIRCFCCSEVCTDNAIEVRRKLFGP
ncbi:MAG TPA: DUF362 domain-containing protein [Bacteroidales bacterium]|nr:DUF362 domain-containing protein [Bacteroidales bacterium]